MSGRTSIAAKHSFQPFPVARTKRALDAFSHPARTQSYLDRKPAAGTRTRRHDDRWKPGDCRERSRQRAGIRRQAAAAVTPRRSDRWQRSRPGRGGATHVVDGNTSASKPLSAMNSCSAARNEFMIASADRKAGICEIAKTLRGTPEAADARLDPPTPQPRNDARSRPRSRNPELGLSWMKSGCLVKDKKHS